MDIADKAAELVASIHDAKANDNAELTTFLRAELAELNNEIVVQGFAPVEIP